MAQVTLDSSALDELNSVETRTLFDTADKLSSLGVGRIVNLPQIIVVGDQSSGKSSVLEAISHVHFPVQGGVCTRFATELVLRPSSFRCVTASVQFADSTKPSHSLQVSDFNQEDIDNIISSAKDKMGLTDIDRSFSKDVLRLEIQGPDMYPLTLVDLPGIFHAATAKQSTEGMATVRELVESYMKKPNSIILAIICANNQLANQAVLQEAAKHDPSKTRTLGVITKPDLLHPGSSNEHEYLQIVRGRDAVHNLGLGWHVLRNLADYETDDGPRDTVEEQFFKSQSWGSVPSANRGIGALRAKLSRTLHDHIRKNLPTVIQDIQDKLSHLEVELDRLGQPRSTPEDMKAYLIDIASRFQRLVQDGIRGHYTDPFFGGFNGTRRKLRSDLRILNRAIRQILVIYGSAQKVTGSYYETSQPLPSPSYLREFLKIFTSNEDLPEPEPITWAELSAELERQAASNQGTELPGYVNMEIVIHLFQKQAKPWKRIAAFYNDLVVKVVRAFITEAFEHIVGSSDSNTTTDAILNSVVLNFFVEKEQQLSIKLQELARPFDEGYARPLDVDFQEAMQKITAEHNKDATEHESGCSESQVGTAISSKSNYDFETDRMIHAMQTFYDMSLRTFTDNVINLGIESCLIQDLPNLFTPRFVNDMDNDNVEKLASESEEVRNYRCQLRDDFKLLKQGLEQCRRYRPRDTGKVPSSLRSVPASPRHNVPTNERPRTTITYNDPVKPKRGATTSTSGPAATKSSKNRSTGNVDASRTNRTPPDFATESSGSTDELSRAASPQPTRSRTISTTMSPSQRGQKPLPDCGLFEITSALNDLSKVALTLNTKSATDNDKTLKNRRTDNGGDAQGRSSSSSGQPNAFFRSPPPKPIFGQSSVILPAFGSAPTQPTGSFGTFGTTSASSCGTTRPLFGEASGAQINTISSGRKGTNVPAANPFARSVQPSSSTSASTDTLFRFGGTG